MYLINLAYSESMYEVICRMPGLHTRRTKNFISSVTHRHGALRLSPTNEQQLNAYDHFEYFGVPAEIPVFSADFKEDFSKNI